MKRLRQFSLRTLLTLMLVCAIVLAMFTVRLHDAKEQQIAVASIIDGGGMVFYSFHLDESGMANMDGTGNLIEPDWFTRKLFGDDFVADVVGAYVNIDGRDDAVWGHLSKLKSLRKLSIAGNSVTDADLDRLELLGHLEALELGGSSNVTDGRIARLNKTLPGCLVSR